MEMKTKDDMSDSKIEEDDDMEQIQHLYVYLETFD